MIKKIAAVTLIGALAISIYNFTAFDAPGTDPGQLTGHPAPPALASGSTPPETGQLDASDSSSLPDAEFDDGTEVVLGIRVRKDRNCEVELKDYVTSEGEMFSAYSCTPLAPAPDHEYRHYDNKTLAAMSYSDAEASALLGRRLIQTDTGRAYELLIRASALDGGNVEHIAWLADQAYGTVEINGEPQVGNLKRLYELATLAARIGHSPARSEYLRNELIRTGTSRDQLNELDKRAEELFRSMREVQQTVLGEITIGGQDDA